MQSSTAAHAAALREHCTAATIVKNYFCNPYPVPSINTNIIFINHIRLLTYTTFLVFKIKALHYHIPK